MRTVGVDLAAEPKNTAIALIDWTERTVRTGLGVTDDQIVEECEGAAKVGIDCPFGWPEAFLDFVAAHREFAPTRPADTIERRREFAYRTTDLWCRDVHGIRPLSVSADRIAHAAFRCVGLLARLDITDRSGTQLAVETYPAGSLRIWGLYEPGYKKAPDRTVRAVLAAADLAAPQPIVSEHEADALVAGITAHLATRRGGIHLVPTEHARAAKVEGWIALPTGPLVASRA